MSKPLNFVPYKEKAKAPANNSLRIIPSEQIIPFKTRLTEVIGEQSVRAFSRNCGLSDKTLRDYMSGKSYPTLDRLAMIADASGRTINWLATGEEAAESNSEQLDEQVLLNVIQAIEMIAKKTKSVIASDKKAQIIVMFYKITLENRKLDYQLIQKAIELAS